MSDHSDHGETGASRPLRRYPAFLKTVCLIVSPAAILFVILTFALSIGAVRGASMEPTYNDYTIEIGARWATPKHQDVVLIQSAALGDKIIKRVIGLPGDTLEIKSGVVYLNGQPLREPYVEYKGGPDMAELVVPEHMLFVLGDNRALSLDSRSPLLGLVPDSELIATVFFTFQSPILPR